MKRAAPASVTYVGTLVSVLVGEHTYPVERRVLGVVPGHGLCTAASRADLRRAVVDGPPSRPRWRPMKALIYDRRRKGFDGRLWIHETPGASVDLRRNKKGVLVAYLKGREERRCDMAGDFLCSSTD